MLCSTLLMMLLLFHIGWYLLSYLKKNKPLPQERVIEQFQTAHENILHQGAVRHVLEQDYIDSGPYRLHLDILPADKDSPVVVFIPGTSIYAQFYTPFMSALHQAGFNVVGFDPRGHGRSSGPRGDYTIDGIVDDTLAVVAYARRRFKKPVALVGSSQGGIVAFYAAARDDALAAVVCHNLADLNGKTNQVLSRIRVPSWSTPLVQAVMGLYGGFLIPIALYLDLTKEFLKDGTPVATYARKDPLALSWISLRALSSLLRTPLAKPVEAIKVPVMVIHPEKDHIFPQWYVESVYNRLGCKKRFCFMKNSSHLVMNNRIDKVVPDVARWLKDVLGAPH
jgi:alpha-beta hydrolase superfamily lysophospholipase